jgi:hypothetical protein
MPKHRMILRNVAAAALLMVSGVASRADVIDGNWCNGEGRHFSISGLTFVTTEGTRTQGKYSRHAFSYTVPTPDPSAGAEIFMILLNETTVRLRVGSDSAAPTEIWRRCDVTSQLWNRERLFSEKPRRLMVFWRRGDYRPSKFTG